MLDFNLTPDQLELRQELFVKFDNLVKSQNTTFPGPVIPPLVGPGLNPAFGGTC